MIDEKGTYDLVARYAIFLAAKELNKPVPDSEMGLAERRIVEHQIRQQPELAHELDLLKRTYIAVYSQLDGTEIGELLLQQKRVARRRRSFHRSAWRRFGVYGVTSTLLIIATFVTVEYLKHPAYWTVAQRSLEEKFSIQRAEVTSDLNVGKAFFNLGRYEDAVRVFAEGLQIEFWESAGPEAAELAFCLGRTHLILARSTFLNSYIYFAVPALDRARDALQIAAWLVGPDSNMLHDIHWYSAVTVLLRFEAGHKPADLADAVALLEQTRADEMRWSEDAGAILARLREQ